MKSDIEKFVKVRPRRGEKRRRSALRTERGKALSRHSWGLREATLGNREFQRHRDRNREKEGGVTLETCKVAPPPTLGKLQYQ